VALELASGGPLGPRCGKLAWPDARAVLDALLEDDRIDIRAISGSSAGAMNAPSISADGRYIAFDSTAANLTGYDSNNRDDVFVKDMLSGAITRASEGANGESLTGEVEGILRPAISADGHYVVFATAAAMLASDNNGVADIYRKDLWTGAIMRVSTDSGENQGDAASFDADISADGRYVSFTSQASNFVAGDGLLSADIFRKDLLTGALLLISRNADGEPLSSRMSRMRSSGSSTITRHEPTHRIASAGSGTSSMGGCGAGLR
jgi:hypothetical protein